MDRVANLNASGREELFRQTTAKFPYLSEAAVEKDFWVCWILQRIFASPLRETVIFKGGTSLSKVFHLIKRFSEDIDLILNWRDNPLGDPLAERSSTKQEKLMRDWTPGATLISVKPCCRKSKPFAAMSVMRKLP